jgi:hypothetical protein
VFLRRRTLLAYKANGIVFVESIFVSIAQSCSTRRLRGTYDEYPVHAMKEYGELEV